MERRRRLALWLMTVCLTATLIYTGHGTFHEDTPVAVLRPEDGRTTVRLKGCVSNPGVYRFPEKTKVATVINMTCPLLAGKIANRALLAREIANGDIIAVTQKKEQLFEISIETMKAKERVVLGIPLDPDLMDLADWDSLPGIGPVLAESIMDDRHKNGAFGSVEALRRVPGIGEERLKGLKKYF